MKAQRTILIAALLIAGGFVWLQGGFSALGASQERAAASAVKPGLARAVFAAGCFWCVEADFDKVEGVITTTSGYTGGRLQNPSYEQVSRGGTGHVEAVEVVYDPAVVSYAELLDHFWHHVDPFVAHRQFCDVGDQYGPEIFVTSPEQRTAAEASKRSVQRQFAEPIVVPITDLGRFYLAEAYHQDFYKKNPVRYRYYRWACGRDARVEQIWSRQDS